jgi:hypothetical protein
MVLISEAAQLKAKLMLKGRCRPEKMVRRKMPDGSGMLASVPQRRQGGRGADADELDAEYCVAIDKVASVFGRQKRANSTADEHRAYIRIFDGWLVRKGFGSFVEVEVNGHGRLVAVCPRRSAAGALKVLKPQMLIGYLLEMASGDKAAPKGGHAGDLLARAGQEAVTACGRRSDMKFKQGEYGCGAFADEPWSLQAYQKRVYAVRAACAARRGAHTRVPDGVTGADCASVSRLCAGARLLCHLAEGHVDSEPGLGRCGRGGAGRARAARGQEAPARPAGAHGEADGGAGRRRGR